MSYGQLAALDPDHPRQRVISQSKELLKKEANMDAPSFLSPHLETLTSAHWIAVIVGIQIIATIFLIAGVNKVLRRESFAEGLVANQVLPAPLARFVSQTIPELEIVLGVGLMTSNAFIGPLLEICLALLAAFTALHIRLMIGKNRAPCSCGLGDRHVGKGTVFRNLILLGITAFILAFPTQNSLHLHAEVIVRVFASLIVAQWIGSRLRFTHQQHIVLNSPPSS